MTEDGYELIVARPAVRAIAETLPEAVSAAVIDFITGSLIENPRRVGCEGAVIGRASRIGCVSGESRSG